MTARSFASRASIPLIICTLGALVAAAMLARPGPAQPTAAPASEPAPTAEGAVQPPAQQSAAPAPSDARIRIADFAFDPGVVVKPGETVTVVNADGAPHTLTSTDGLFDTGNLAGGAEGSFIAPEVAGTYAFFCAIHPSMTGSVTVTP